MSQHLLGLLLDNLEDYALFTMDERGVAVSWTPGVLRLLGYEEAEFLGFDTSLIFTQQDRVRGLHLAEREKAAQEGRARDVRWHRRKDGTVFWGNGQMIALREDDGQLIGFAKILRDDTSRRKMEEDLRETRERLQTALDVGGIGTWSWDIPNDRVTADRNLARFFGVSPDDAAGGPLEKYTQSVHPDDIEQLFENLERAITSDLTFSQDYRLLQKDGSLLWVEARGRIEQDSNGRPLQLNGVVLDITERKSTEDAMRRSEERYRTLFEAIDNGFCVIDMIYDENDKPIDYRFVEINPAFKKQTGMQDAIGKSAKELVPDLDEFWFKTYGRVGLTGESVQFESWADAMQRWFEVSAFRIGPPELRRVALLFADITARRQGEEALREAHVQAEETNRIKDQFLATLSHELRTPLNAILGWANILRTNELDRATQKKGLETIERNARSQAQLINDLLDVSRILTGKMHMELQPVELAELVDNAVKNVLPAMQAKQIQLETNIDRSTGFISGDADRLSQVFWNLLSNAIKFTPQGGRITVNLMRVDAQVQVQVIDTGEGISAEFLPHLFERFRQADASSTRTYGGLGIGLALVRHLMEAHGGTVHAESPGEGKGSTFSVIFPLQAVQPPLQDVVEEPEGDVTAVPEAERPGHDLTGLRILVVDDEADAREMAELALQRRGAMVAVADSVEKAFDLFLESRDQQTPFDVLVSDIGMPLADGYELIRRIRSFEKLGEDTLPAIALTAFASPKDRMDALLAGFQEHVAKPVDPNDLTTTIAAVTGRLISDHDLAA
jgi:PAS domain S-box-containing protein